MTGTPTASSVQLARAEALGKALAHRGWNSRHESTSKHPGAVGSIVRTHPDIEILILTLGGTAGQMVEITAQGVSGHRGTGFRRVREVSPSWRMTAYDAPIQAILAAATAATASAPDPNPLELPEWTIERATRRSAGDNAVRYAAGLEVPLGGRVRATRFTRPDSAVVVTFHLPTYTPPCEHCTHHGDLGDIGGWLITGPGLTAEATAHTPAAVISAFTRALPGHALARPTATPNGHTVEPRRWGEAVPAAAVFGARPITAVC
ncbi:hypothetical protein ABH935_005410 [Catenulispora sp. GAS73]|uniref:hypothetical protein n=1 Tax=Catenulispora sp. GAS73 TaxID=3156269 RepID=UPI0035164170